MPLTQKTLLHDISFSGVGIHSGKPVQMVLKPAPAHFGIRFIRLDLGDSEVPVKPQFLTSASRCTQLQHDKATLSTPEHLLAACWGLGLDNLLIEIDSEEVPILDGSSLVFVQSIRHCGLRELSAEKSLLNIQTPLVVTQSGATLIVLPHPTSQFTYVVDYPHSFVGSQVFTWNARDGDFETDIAPARTYGFEHEIQALLAQGLAQGGTFDNALVIGEKQYLSPPRFENELARHKLLDMIGDLSILGKVILGHVIGIKSGHSLNAQLVSILNGL